MQWGLEGPEVHSDFATAGAEPFILGGGLRALSASPPRGPKATRTFLLKNPADL